MKIHNLNKSCSTYCITAFLFLITTISCKTTKISNTSSYKINFLDEYIYKGDATIHGIKIGGLSGIDFTGNYYVLISDTSKKSSIFTANIQIENNKILSVNFVDAFQLDCKNTKHYDAESIRYLAKDKSFLISTEGNIKANSNPEILKIDSLGVCSKPFKIPNYFQSFNENKPRNNRAFEGLSLDFKHEGFWVITETPLVKDGKPPKLYNTFSPLRLTYFTNKYTKPQKQHVYNLDRLIKIPFLPFGLNGATEILQIDSNQLLIVERAFSAGHQSKGYRIKLFLVNIKKGHNVLEHQTLKGNRTASLSKTLLFDSKKIRKQLKFNFIDNIEGISFGPTLPNGNKSLILVSDNNFNAIGEQLNQFLLLELVKN